jgi:hypothetical protein
MEEDRVVEVGSGREMDEGPSKLGVVDEERWMRAKGEGGGKAVSLDARLLGFLVDRQLEAMVLDRCCSCEWRQMLLLEMPTLRQMRERR